VHPRLHRLRGNTLTRRRSFDVGSAREGRSRVALPVCAVAVVSSSYAADALYI
jgi:hypothetical protein